MTTFDFNDTNVLNFEQRKQLISTFKKRFLTYGYKQIRTSTFEPYDLYSNVQGTIPQDEMIKVIDSTGKVLVLRPDVTIPVTEEVAKKYPNLQGTKRYFYVLDVFRQSFDGNGSKERTQAGVEFFGADTPEADAEVIALAIQTLNDLRGDLHFKVEIGHAGFFKQLAEQMNLTDRDFAKLKQYIQAKNMTELDPFLKNLEVNEEISNAIRAIPLLYGEFGRVITRAKEIALNEEMTRELDHLKAVYDVLKSYGASNHVVLDLGLINHMNYYTDIIFQGFITNVAKPVLTGGRYNNLAEQFNASIPAIGFACDIEALLEGTSTLDKTTSTVAELAVLYNKENEQEALTIANTVRNLGYSTLTFLNDSTIETNCSINIYIDADGKRLESESEKYTFNTVDDMTEYIVNLKENQ